MPKTASKASHKASPTVKKNKAKGKEKKATPKKKTGKKKNPSWYYWLDNAMDGRGKGWHQYDDDASLALEGFLQNKGKKLSKTAWKLKSGHFSYEVDISVMTQKNTKTGTVRPIRRVLPSETIDLAEPPVFVPPTAQGKSTKKGKSKKHKAEEQLNPTKSAKKAKKTHPDTDDEDDSEDNKVKKAPPKKSGVKPAASKGDDSKEDALRLGSLFNSGCGHHWESVLASVLKAQPNAADFVGPKRDSSIIPVREMTFRALMALPPEENNLIVFGQAPYPRVESASGIAMFDSLIADWDCSQFGKTVSMRCIAKAAAVAKGLVPQSAKIADLRKAFHEHDIVSPPEWFQAMLAQGVLLLNASLTIGNAFSKTEHTKFWMPIMERIVGEILSRKKSKFKKGAPKRRIGFLWWGGEALKTKKALAGVLAKFENDVEITHIEHYNPAAQGDQFSRPPNHFQAVNKALRKGRLEPIDWLPNKQWLSKHHVDDHASFITETKELHKLYLDRLQAGLDTAELDPIQGVMKSDLLSLPDACDPIGLAQAAQMALTTVKNMSVKGLCDDEKGAVYLYTTNVLYRRVNEALRDPNRNKIKVFYQYLRLFLEAYSKMNGKSIQLFRGIRKDLSSLYEHGSTVTWWTISSCTPSIDVAKNFGGNSPDGTLFHVEAKTAVPIMHLSAYKNEEEYVLAPGTQLKVTKIVKKSGQATQIFMSEVKGKRLVS